MKRVKLLTCSVLAVLAAMLLTGCQWNENPVRTSLEIEQTDLTLQVGETATRHATTKSKDYEFIYTSSNPAVATVDQNGKVTALSVGEATITVTMPETKIGWYAAATREYKVFVKKVSAAALADVDKSTPLTLVALEDGKITVTFNNGVTLKNDIHYTINGGAEQTIAKNTSGAYDITVKKGDVVQLYSINTTLGGGGGAAARGFTRAVDSSAKFVNIKPSMKTEIYGNVMSMLKGKDNLESAQSIEASNALYGLFAGADKLVNDDERMIMLPANDLKPGCYEEMFSGCEGMTTAPELPASKLVENCYAGMFSGCKKLEAVKILANDVAATGALKDFLTGAGTEAEKKPVIEVATTLPEGTIPSNFTEATAVTGIKLSETTLEMTVSDTKPLTATLTPTDATNKTLEWTTSNSAVVEVTVDLNDNTKATVTALGAGSATITCSTPDGSVKATCAVTVAAPQQETAEMYFRYYDSSEDSWKNENLVEGSYALLTSDMTTLSSDYESYVVVGNVVIDGRVTLAAEFVRLVICDGATLTVKDGILTNDKGLMICGQNNGTGKLIVNRSTSGDVTYRGDAINVGALTIEGVEVVATANTAGYAMEAANGSLLIYGGKVTATAADENDAITSSGDITITGGQINATCEGGATISGTNVTITTGITSITLDNTSVDNNNLSNWISATTLNLGSSLANVTDVKTSWGTLTSPNSTTINDFNVARNGYTLVLTKAAN